MFRNYSPVVREWLTIWHLRFLLPNLTTQRKKEAFHSQTTFPLAEWIDARCEPRISPPASRPCNSTIAIQVPNRTHAACCWSVHMTNYFWAYYQKSALARGSGLGEGGLGGVQQEGEGSKQSLLRICKQRKRTDSSNKELKSIKNGCRRRATKSSTKVSKSLYVCVCVHFQRGWRNFVVHICFGFTEMYNKGELKYINGDKNL